LVKKKRIGKNAAVVLPSRKGEDSRSVGAMFLLDLTGDGRRSLDKKKTKEEVGEEREENGQRGGLARRERGGDVRT